MVNYEQYDCKPDADLSWAFAEEYSHISDILAVVPGAYRDAVLRQLRLLHDRAFMAGATALGFHLGVLKHEEE